MGQMVSNVGLLGQIIQESMWLLLFVRVYQVNGYMKVKFDFLGFDDRNILFEFDFVLYGFFEVDFDREFFFGVW